MSEEELCDHLLVIINAYDKNAPVAVQQATAVICTLLGSLKDGSVGRLSQMTGNYSAEALQAAHAREN